MSVSKAIKSVSDLISEFIEDPDKKAELTVKLSEVLLTTTTTPKTDAFVKILLAFRDIIIPMFRPVGSIAMAVFGAWCIKEGVELPEPIQYILFGAPIGWGLSRHGEKKAKAESEWMKDNDP